VIVLQSWTDDRGGVLTKAEEYRRRAQEIELKAALTKDAETKHLLKEVAEQWRQMAQQAEALGW
jgi:hypothetical protein